MTVVGPWARENMGADLGTNLGCLLHEGAALGEIVGEVGGRSNLAYGLLTKAASVGRPFSTSKGVE